MNKLYTLLLVISSLVCFGQKQNNNWCFGDHAGVTFNSGTAVSFSGSAVYAGQQEGVSAISDANGNLLCYTDGNTVWNKTNVAMPSGTGLLGNFSTSEGALIVPQPGNDSIYFVFTLDQENGPNGLNYSVVNMKLDGGLGDVSQLNIQLQSGTLYSEKMIGIFNSNNTDVWVIVHVSYTNTFHAYLVTSSGVNPTPVSTSVGQTYSNEDAVGTMHCTLDGTRIAASYWGPLSGYEVFDFDKSTGVLSNPLYLTSPNYTYAYSVCFSPSGRYMYGGCFNTDQIYQFDLNQGSPVGLLITYNADYVGELQIGPDSIIYCSLDGNNYLSAIEHPDSAGGACDFVANAVSIAPATNWIGLTNYIYPSGVAIAPPVAQFTSTDSAFCAGTCISFTNLSQKAVSYLWRFPGAIPATDTSANPANVCYYNGGLYDVTLIATNGGGSDSVTFTNYINVGATPPTPVITPVGNTLYCSTDSTYTSYQWYDSTALIPGATDTFLVVTQSGNYNVQVKNASDCQVAAGISFILGLEEFTVYGLQFTVFPNPVRNELWISSEEPAIKNIEIYNVLGEKIYSSQPETVNRKPETVIDVSFLSSGIYFVRVASAGGEWVGRFVKE